MHFLQRLKILLISVPKPIKLSNLYKKKYSKRRFFKKKCLHYTKLWKTPNLNPCKINYMYKLNLNNYYTTINWWIIKLPDYLLKCPKIQICCFTRQICRLKSWMKLRIRESFFFHSTGALTFVSWRKLGITSRDDLFVSLEELCYFLFISREKRKCILHFHFSRKKRKHILSLVFQGKRRETSHIENKK